jgi:hypothetical protein
VTDGVDDILASQHNTPLQDIAADLNIARPIVAGGTGATSADAALTAFGGTVTGKSVFTIADVAALQTLIGFSKTLASPFNQVLPGGLIIKGGGGTTSGIGIQDIVFATAFPTACIWVGVTPITTSTICGTGDAITNSGFQARTFASTTGSFAPCGYRWSAIGY